MTDEEKAEEKYQEHINKEDCYVSKSEEEIYTDGFFDGLAEGRKETFSEAVIENLKENTSVINSVIIGKLSEKCEQLEKGNEQLKKEISILLSCANCKENKGGYVCEKEYNDKCLAQKIEYIKELKGENAELESKLNDSNEKCNKQALKITELEAQIEKMKRCFNCLHWFSDTELCVSNERGTSICDKWELAE